jgi:hypothetical protein
MEKKEERHREKGAKRARTTKTDSRFVLRTGFFWPVLVLIVGVLSVGSLILPTSAEGQRPGIGLPFPPIVQKPPPLPPRDWIRLDFGPPLSLEGTLVPPTPLPVPKTALPQEPPVAVPADPRYRR